MIHELLALSLIVSAPAVQPGLEPLSFLVGHCWEGQFATGERDRHCFEPVYGGKHIRDRHEVTGPKGVYRGETIYSREGETVTFTYWNSLGGVSRGTMRSAGDRLDFGDETYKGPDGKEFAISTHWRRLGEEAFEAVTASAQSPALNQTIRYARVAEEPVAISSSLDPDGTHRIVHEVVVAAAQPEVWKEISTAEGWKTWAVPVAWLEGDLLETSYSPSAARGDPSTIQQQIAARIPGRLLVFRTVKAPQRFPDFDTFRKVTHMIELEPEGEARTRVRLTSAGYADTDAGRRLLGFFRDGNRITLERMSQRFLAGPLDWSEVLKPR